MATQPSLHDVVVRHQVLLERLKVSTAAQFNALLPELLEQVQRFVLELDSTPFSGVQRGKLNQILNLLQREQGAALERRQADLFKSMKSLSEYEVGFELVTLTEVTGAALTAGAVDSAWVAAMTTPLSATGHLLDAWVQDMTKAEVAVVNRTIMRGYAEGWTNQQLIAALKGTRAARYTDGLLPRMGKHNATIVRTAVQHVSHTAREHVWKQNADIITKYRWVSTLDGRTSQQCRSLDGQEFEIGKGPRPPVHPNCRSTVIPVLKGGLAKLAEGRTRASADGPVASDMTYYEWLRTQSASFQRDVLGPSRYELFNSPDMTAEEFARLNLSSTFQPLTLEQMRKIERK